MEEKYPIELSVIIPCWNVAPWLPRCLEEVFTALPPKSEVIAVDDGSEDATLEILLEFSSKYPELKVLSQKNSGVSAARNRALDVSKGEYIFFVDPDDGVEPEFFTLMINRMKEKKADYCVVAFKERSGGNDGKSGQLKGVYEYSSNSEIIEGYVSRIFGYSFNDVQRLYKGEALFSRREMASVCRACFRRSIIKEFSIRFDESIVLYEDAMFNTEYLLYANSMTCINKALYRVTERDSGAMKSIPRNASRLAHNKLRLLAARKRLNLASGGRLWHLCGASSVFSLLEILSLMIKCRLSWREGREILREYMSDESVKRDINEFPLSYRKPVLASAIVFFRIISAIFL